MGKRKQCEADSGVNMKKKKKKDDKEKACVTLKSSVCTKKEKTIKKLKTTLLIPQETRQVCEEVTEVKAKKKSKKHVEQEGAKSKPKKKQKSHKTEVSDQDETTNMEEEDKHTEGQEVEDLSPEEKRILERKLKKQRKKEEKRRLTAGKSEEIPEEQKPTAAQLALQYLTSWSKKSTSWKFQKTRQTWLLQNMFDLEKISDKNFSVLLSYMEGLQGVARDTTVQKAEAFVQELEKQGMEEVASQQRAERARQVIQLLV